VLKPVSMLHRAAQRGISLVELMVGIAIGMIVVAGASVMMVNQLADHRRLILETQIQQDLRAAADLMLRELRRAGSWATPQRGVWAPGDAITAPISNPYAVTTPLEATDTSSQVEYSYSRHDDRSKSAPAAPEDNVLESSKETFGFRLTNGVLQFRLGDKWQPLTDDKTLVIRAFNVKLNVQKLDLGAFCHVPCPVGSTTCPPQQELRRFDITLTGQAVHDEAVQRTISVSSRMRNDHIVGSCAS